jgi:hypothetical protein
MKKGKMMMTRRIFISSPRDEYLDAHQNQLKWAIIDAIAKLKYEPQLFGSPDGGKGLAAGSSWSPYDADRVMRRCVGAAILGFPIWTATSKQRSKRVSLATEYNHYEGALAWTHGLPILSVLEEGTEERVAFNRYGNAAVIRPPRNAGEKWVTKPGFQAFLQGWHLRMRERKDVFLGYCSSSKSTAALVKKFMVKECNATVLDWQSDFIEGRTILAEIQEAARRTTGGVFLFTKDDLPHPAGPAATRGFRDEQAEQAVPRDNVVFEAGFFARAKGPERVLIIREEGAKMPADLGGDIYAPLPDRRNINVVKSRIRRFLTSAL